ncbi:hypothetical protein LTR37_014026 [Vermiconidia calcicola]|uniref:Uncharacterized protein n=1 Tax=Vermiconidia calcicola TaxID=1690605 RepID=A0ACC3MVM6_9PEZI|nr:hypothetical protein LTR37_014026 [Vermiconidia calcicola]
MSLFLHRPLPIRLPAYRTFTTTAHRSISLQLEKNDPSAVADTVPGYPYGPAYWYKQSNKGLYGAQRIQFGNNVGPKFNTKTRRSWHPNVFRKKLYSPALRRHVQVRVSARVLRTIDKLGGLDEYLLGEKEMRVKELGMSGWWLRWAIMQTPAVRRRFREERKRLGLPEEGIEGLVAEMETTEEGELQIASKGEDLLETEPVASDDAFTIEHNPELPPLKFRVGPKQHLVLTPSGWRRTRPNHEPDFKAQARKTDASVQKYVDLRTRRIENLLKENLATTTSEEEPKTIKLQPEEKDKITRGVKTRVLNEALENKWQARVRTIAKGKRRRRQVHEARVKAEVNRSDRTRRRRQRAIAREVNQQAEAEQASPERKEQILQEVKERARAQVSPSTRAWGAVA